MEFFILAAMALGVTSALAGAWWFSEEQRARRALKSAPHRRIRDAPEGEVARIDGRTEVLETLEAPLSGRACVCWRVAVSEGGSNPPRVVLEECDGLDFLVVDGTDKALVEVKGARALLYKDRSYTWGVLNDPAPELRAFLDARGIATKGGVFDKVFDVSEGVLGQGEQVTVLGLATWQPDPDAVPSAGGAYREARSPRRLVMTSAQDGPLVLTNDPSLLR